MANGLCPFGGTPGVLLDLEPADAPRLGYRILSGHIWWRYLYWEWRRYSALRAAFILASPPLLALFGSGVFLTDRQSLQGIQDPAGLARRVGLSMSSQLECSLFGCAVVAFAVPEFVDLIPSSAYPGGRPGLTVGGGREWKTKENIKMGATMTVTYVEATGGSRYYQIQL